MREKARNKDPSVREANMSPLSSPNRSPGTHARDNSLVARVVVFGFFAHNLSHKKQHQSKINNTTTGSLERCAETPL